MLFLKRKDKDVKNAAPKRGSLLWKAVNPELGKSIRPLAQTASVFVQLIAMVFAMNGLFPKDHPGLTGGPDGAVRLRLSDVIRTAWNDLSFTEEGAPKVLLFFAVTGTIVLAILSVVTALMMGFVGSAHAQVTSGTGVGNSTFFASAGANDLAQNALDYIFKAIPISNNYAQNGLPIPATVNIQCAMQSALGFYSNAMLMFAAIILFYHLATMIVNTAHHGVVMGKQANQVWAPIRLVVAIGLLVPIGSGPAACSSNGSKGAGMNSGQYIVVKMAELGSGMASQTWKTFLNTLAGLRYNYVQPGVPFVNEAVHEIVKMEACRWAWDFQICKQDRLLPSGQTWNDVCGDPINNYSPSGDYQDQYIGPPTKQTMSNGDDVYVYSPNNMPDAQGICGQFTVPGTVTSPKTATANMVIGTTLNGSTVDPTSVAANIATAQKSTVEQLIGSGAFEKVGAEIAWQIAILNDGKPTRNADYLDLVILYQTTLKTNLDAAFGKGTNASLDVTQIGGLGWAAAGAWLNTLTRDQGSIVNAYQDGLPKDIVPPNDDKLKVDTIGNGVWLPLMLFDNWLKKGVDLGTGEAEDVSVPNTVACDIQAVAASGAIATNGAQGSSTAPQANPQAPPLQYTRGQVGMTLNALGVFSVQDMVDDLLKSIGGDGSTIVKKMLNIVDKMASNSGIWLPENDINCGAGDTAEDHFSLGAQLVTANPLAELSFWGYANLSAGYHLFEVIVDYSMMGAAKGADLQILNYKGMGSEPFQIKATQQGLELKFVGFVTTVLGTIASIFLGIGYSLAFVLPLFPFFRFFFAVLTWIVSVLEAVAAVSLIALAHLNPEGEGLPGQTAKASYFMVFNVFLRPTMTIFGLIAGIIVFYIAIIFLNATYALAVAGTNGMYHFGEATLIRLAYTFIYAATAYTCANTCFKTIDMFPDQAMRWISANAHSERMGDEMQAVKGVMGQFANYGNDRAVGVAQLKGGQ